MTTGPIHDLLHRDHARLEGLLDAAARGSTIDLDAYREFRGGLLRHIGMEEKILLPAARRSGDGELAAVTRQLKLDHAALAALLVPTPTPAIVERLRALLVAHNAVEEGEGGVYARCENVLGVQSDELLERLKSAPQVALAPYQDGPRAFASIERLLRAAGRS
jgi:hypothetical protein